MEHMIIGTAGHIDHGKTALIHALTGRDTDTLKEEKERGISINLGFTYFDLPDGSRAGVIDVPGHEKFLSNMLAGVCGMDLVLLVIALDKGVMPQTREHMEILKYLNVRQGIVVLTKYDLVEKEWADMMEEEVKSELASTIFANWKCVRVSSKTGEGIEQLKKEMMELSSHLERIRETDRRFRMPIDRVMSLKGLGTVVAGTVLEGTIKTGEELSLYTSGIKTYVKSVQVHGKSVEKAHAGQRCAMLLSNVKKESVRRGDVAAYPDSLHIAQRMDVLIRMDSETERKIINQSRAHLYIGTSEVVCRIVLLEHNELQRGEKAYAQLILEKPLAVRKGDYFVLRFYSPLEIIGGGIVLDECAVKHKRKQKEVIDYLKNKEENQDSMIVKRVIQDADKPVSLENLEQECKMDPHIVNQIVTEIADEQGCIVFATKKRNFYWSYASEEKMWDMVEQFLHQFHQEHPYREGIEKMALKSQIFPKWEMNLCDIYLQLCECDGRIHRGADGNSYHLVGEEPQMDEKLEQLLQGLKREFNKAGAGFLQIKAIESKAFANAEEYMDAVKFLARTGAITRISDEFYTTNTVADEVKTNVLHFFETNEIISFASLRDLLGTSRRSAKPLIAYLDEQKITTWCGKETERKKYKTGGKSDE